MKKCLLSIVFAILFTPLGADAQEIGISRRDGFLLIWQSIGRPVESTKEKPFIDVLSGDVGFEQITFAKSRGILDDDEERFRPDAPLEIDDALLWLFRTRSIERPSHDVTGTKISLADPADVIELSEKYGLKFPNADQPLTRDVLFSLMRQLDDRLMREEHEVSLYSEKFHGKGTAFGETFDMHALTAAHRTFPRNTLVKVTNIENGKSVTVRINDRGPFVKGRDMDLSLGSFLVIAERSQGKIQATFERLGDSTVSSQCADPRRQMRVTRNVIVRPGIPHHLVLGKTLSLTSTTPFVILDITFPDGNRTGTQTWVTKGESFEFSPSVIGSYVFRVGSADGRGREMRMEVVTCDN